jgi:hypothetical protein
MPAAAVLRSRVGLILAVVGAISVGGILAGFLLGLEGFSSNVLAELSGAGLSVVIAVFLVERILSAQRRDQWATVRSSSLRALQRRLDDVAAETYLIDGMHDRVLHAETDAERVEAIHDVAAFIVASAGRLAKHPEDPWATSKALYDSIHADLGFIRDVIGPRFLLFGDDPLVAQRLLELEAAESEWSQGVQLIQDDWGFPNELAWERAGETFKAISNLYRVVVELAGD